MNISRTKFVILFIISAFTFMFISNAIFGLEARVFPWNEQSFLGTDSPIVWKSIGYKVLYPIKVVLMLPVLPFDNFLQDDPPPPLVALVFSLYWSILALVIYYLVGRLKRT